MDTREIPNNWPQLMPIPSVYYRTHVWNMGEENEYGWVSCDCPLKVHAYDAHRCNVNLWNGRFNCPLCGTGDLLLFHMMATGKLFRESVLELIGEKLP